MSADTHCSGRVFLVRHGESYWNQAKNANPEVDPMIFDAALTPRGIDQAKVLANAVAVDPPALVVVSPLSRALQTATVALTTPPPACLTAGKPAARPLPRVIVTPLAAEFLRDSCDVGRPTSIVRHGHEDFDWSLMPDGEVWWWTPPQDSDKDGGDTARAGSVGLRPEDVGPDGIPLFKPVNEYFWCKEFARTRFAETEEALAARIHALKRLVRDQLALVPPSEPASGNCGTPPPPCVYIIGHGDLFHHICGVWLDNCGIHDATQEFFS